MLFDRKSHKTLVFFNISTLPRCNYYVYFSNKSLFFVSRNYTTRRLHTANFYKYLLKKGN